MDEEEFRNKFTRFLFGSKGSKHRLLMGFEEDIECGEPAPHLTMSMLQFTHNLMDGPKEQIPAMNWVKQTIKEANFTNRVFPMCIGYASWETDEVSKIELVVHHSLHDLLKVISEELYRNIFLAILCVLLTTWMLLFNFTASLLVSKQLFIASFRNKCLI